MILDRRGGDADGGAGPAGGADLLAVSEDIVGEDHLVALAGALGTKIQFSGLNSLVVQVQHGRVVVCCRGQCHGAEADEQHSGGDGEGLP